jgi:hypothetical protein
MDLKPLPINDLAPDVRVRRTAHGAEIWKKVTLRLGRIAMNPGNVEYLRQAELALSKCHGPGLHNSRRTKGGGMARSWPDCAISLDTASTDRRSRRAGRIRQVSPQGCRRADMPLQEKDCGLRNRCSREDFRMKSSQPSERVSWTLRADHHRTEPCSGLLMRRGFDSVNRPVNLRSLRFAGTRSGSPAAVADAQSCLGLEREKANGAARYCAGRLRRASRRTDPRGTDQGPPRG